MITQIRIGKFHPDVGRSGMVASSPMSSSEESEPDWSDTCEVDEEKKMDFTQTASHVEESDSETDASESSSSSTSRSLCTDAESEEKAPTHKDIVTSFNGSLVLNSYCLHIEGDGTLRCGRPLPTNLKYISSLSDMYTKKCRSCFI